MNVEKRAIQKAFAARFNILFVCERERWGTLEDAQKTLEYLTGSLGYRPSFDWLLLSRTFLLFSIDVYKWRHEVPECIESSYLD